ncbi:MAG: glycosyltransferase 87 family protein [bacterium]
MVETGLEAGPEDQAGAEPATRARRQVLAAAAAALVAKLFLAATTYGTRDVNHWRDFVAGVRRAGPVGVYRLDFPASYYNHPPLMGHVLEVVAVLERHGVSVGFSIRALASLSDVVSALVVFELVRTRCGVTAARWAGIGVALSPVLFVISGYHANTDPVFCAFVLLAALLLADRGRPGEAGAALGLALGVKVVAVVAVPALCVLALRQGRTSAVRFLAGFAAVLAVTWGPAVLRDWTAVRVHVLEYAGSNDRPQWGVMQVGHWLDDPGWVAAFSGHGRFAVVMLCAGGAAALVWFRPGRAAEAVALALATFLFLSPAFGSQYLVWAVAGAYLLDRLWATVFGLAAGAVLLETYTRWNGSLRWDYADQWGFDHREVVALFVCWLILGVVLLRGVWSTGSAPSRGPVPHAQGRPRLR